MISAGASGVVTDSMASMPPIDPVFFNPDYHDLIGLIYDAVNSEEGFFPFLQRFVEVFEGHSASFAIYDTKAQAAVGFWVVNVPEHALAFYAEHIAHRDALINAAMEKSTQGQPGFVASNLDLGPSAAEIRVETRAGEWLESYGAHEAAGAIALQSENYLNFFAIQRSIDQTAFTREQLAVFDLFLPHINRAVGLYTKMSSLNLGHTPERLALNNVQRGILVCDASFKVVFKNSTADDVIAANPGISLSEREILSFQGKDFTTRFIISLSMGMRASIDRSDLGETVLCYRQGKQNLTVVISPLSAAHDNNSEERPHRGGVMISLYDWSVRPNVNTETLQHFFELTEAEARVSALLVKGNSPAEIADSISRSRETVKSHLRSIFRKTNTTRQGELVALLSASSALA